MCGETLSDVSCTLPVACGGNPSAAQECLKLMPLRVDREYLVKIKVQSERKNTLYSPSVLATSSEPHVTFLAQQ